MKKLSRIGLTAATILTLIGTSASALASDVQPRGMIDEQSKVTAMPASAGGGNVYTWSKVNVSTNSIYLLDSNIYTGYAGATLSQRSVYVSGGNTVWFTGIYDFHKESCEYKIKHVY